MLSFCLIVFLHFWQRTDEEIDIFMERLNLKNENTEFWRKRFNAGEDVLEEEFLARASAESDDDTFEDDEEDEDDEDDLQVEDSTDDPVEDGGEEDEGEPPEMLAMQLLKNKKDLPDKEVCDSCYINICLYAQTVNYVLVLHLFLCLASRSLKCP